MIWQLYFWDGSTYSSKEGEPQDSPPDYALAVIQPSLPPNDKDRIIVGADWLMWRTDKERWTQCGVDGLGDQCILFGDKISCFRKGLWLPTDDWRGDREAVWNRARRDIEAIG